MLKQCKGLSGGESEGRTDLLLERVHGMLKGRGLWGGMGGGLFLL